MSGNIRLGQEHIQALMRHALAFVLTDIKAADTDYDKRYGLVLHALSVAQQAGFPCGVRFDPEEPEWPVAVIELPEGQVSWHIPAHSVRWDGHTTEEKYRRVQAYVDAHQLFWQALEELEEGEVP